MEEIEITEQRWLCFVLDHSEIYISADKDYAYARPLDGDDDDDSLILWDKENGIEFSDDYEIFGGDILSHITAVPSAQSGLTSLFGFFILNYYGEVVLAKWTFLNDCAVTKQHEQF